MIVPVVCMVVAVIPIPEAIRFIESFDVSCPARTILYLEEFSVKGSIRSDNDEAPTELTG